MRSVGNDIVSMYYSILDQRRAETPEDDCECTNPIGVRDLPLTTYASASLLSSKSWGIVPQKPQLYPKFWGFFLSGGVRLYIIPEIPGCAIIPDKY
jgi:hypothetical protein